MTRKYLTCEGERVHKSDWGRQRKREIMREREREMK